MRMLLFAVAAMLSLAGCTTALTPETYIALAKTCETGSTMYAYIKAASTTGAVRPVVEARADQAYAILKPLCDKGAAATQTDIVLAGAQVYVLTKAWRDAT